MAFNNQDTYEQLRRLWHQERPHNATFISFDVETYEHDHKPNHKRLIEVGYCIFNPRNQNQQNFHYVMQDAISDDLFNGDIVPDNRDEFKHGHQKSLPRLGSFFDSNQRTTEVVDEHHIARKMRNTLQTHRQKGPVYFVFHYGEGDIEILRRFGINTREFLNGIPTLIPDFDYEERVYPVHILDTCSLFKAIRTNESANLQKMCVGLGVIKPQSECFFHNAGNDAYWTAKALMCMANGPSLTEMRGKIKQRLDSYRR